jgi:hypothetical protein
MLIPDPELAETVIVVYVFRTAFQTTPNTDPIAKPKAAVTINRMAALVISKDSIR